MHRFPNFAGDSGSILLNSTPHVTFRRVGVLEDDALAELLCAHERVLCIVNSRKAAQSIFSKLPEEGRFHLSHIDGSGTRAIWCSKSDAGK